MYQMKFSYDKQKDQNNYVLLQVLKDKIKEIRKLERDVNRDGYFIKLGIQIFEVDGAPDDIEIKLYIHRFMKLESSIEEVKKNVYTFHFEYLTKRAKRYMFSYCKYQKTIEKRNCNFKES